MQFVLEGLAQCWEVVFIWKKPWKRAKLKIFIRDDWFRKFSLFYGNWIEFRLLWKSIVEAKHAELRNIPSKSLNEGFREVHARKGFAGIIMECIRKCIFSSFHDFIFDCLEIIHELMFAFRRSFLRRRHLGCRFIVEWENNCIAFDRRWAERATMITQT